jgi:hypothetical protein
VPKGSIGRITRIDKQRVSKKDRTEDSYVVKWQDLPEYNTDPTSKRLIGRYLAPNSESEFSYRGSFRVKGRRDISIFSTSPAASPTRLCRATNHHQEFEICDEARLAQECSSRFLKLRKDAFTPELLV